MYRDLQTQVFSGAIEIFVDLFVIMRADAECAGSKMLAVFERAVGAFGFKHIFQVAIIFLGRDDDDVMKIFSCGADQGDTPDIYFLDDAGFVVGRADGVFKRVEVYDDQVDWWYFVALELSEVIFFPACEDTPEDFGVEGFDPAIEDGWIACECFHRYGFGAKGMDIIQAPAGAVHGDFVFFKEADDMIETFFMVDRDEGGADGLSAGHEQVG